MNPPDPDPHVIHINTARSWRGGERQVYNLACELKRLGVAQCVVGKPESELGKRIQAEQIDFVGLELRNEWDFLSARALRKLAIARGANLLHAHTARAHSIALWARRKLPGVRLIVSRRVDFPARKNWFSRRKYLSPLVDRYIAISENVRSILKEDGISEERISIAYSGIDLGPFRDMNPNAAAEIRAKHGIESDTTLIGNVAALVDHKDHATLLRAIAHLKDRAPSFRVLLLGDGELRASLEARARDLGIDDVVVFCGFQSKILDYCAAFDLFVMSSKEEGLGTAVLDAMASGLAVVATRGGGIPEMVQDPEGGRLVNVGDDRALADALEEFILNPRMRKQCGEFNRNRVKDFSCEATARDTVEIYKEVLRQ